MPENKEHPLPIWISFSHGLKLRVIGAIKQNQFI